MERPARFAQFMPKCAPRVGARVSTGPGAGITKGIKAPTCRPYTTDIADWD